MTYAFFDLRVLRSVRLGPTMRRVTFGGAGVDGLASGGRDQRIKLFLPHRHQAAPLVPVAEEDWFGAWRGLDPGERAIMRTYTVRAQRPGSIDVDFALHGDTGPASRWACLAQPGDRVTVLGPTERDNAGVDFRPPPGAARILLAGDETALPAIGGILEHLAAGTAADVWIEVRHADDRQELVTRADASVRWLVRGATDALVEAVPAAAFAVPDYAWIAGESGTVRALRRHLVGERGLDRRTVTFTGYWRKGDSEEDLLAEVAAGRSPHTEE
ncbi:siderophore-interacting protein [Actinomadura rayongensis]|uniref:SIP domain-containing protein n=1 Tax=Actinomadura rayongensis TaxID=1429076 RepID=A0A6I4WAQ1_9ACTN|nr:siderophore-interacting protein [Actinomadura rayongensis]MXQ63802.1 SIP domain-containing protein [Actinomadura rayongensis]